MQAALLGLKDDRGYNFTACHGVQKRIASYKYTEGWTTAKYFRVNSKNYFFLLRDKGMGKSGTNVQVRKVNSNGGIGNPIKEYKWTEGWTTAEFYTVGRKTYLFLMREKGLSGSKKNVHVHLMNFDGTIGKRIDDEHWKEGWTTAKFYRQGNQTFLFLLREKGLSGSKKNVHIHKIKPDGRIGDRVTDYKWGEGWTSAEFFTMGNQTYLFLLREKGLSGSKKNVHIHKINRDGSIGQRVKDYRWSSGWTSVDFYESGGETFLFLLKAKGAGASGDNVHIHKMNNNGTVGKRETGYRWTQGWTSVDFGKNGDERFMVLLKKKGMSGKSGKNVHVERVE